MIYKQLTFFPVRKHIIPILDIAFQGQQINIKFKGQKAEY